MRTQLSTPPALVERTTLPRIFVRTKGTVKYHGHVSGYIAGPATRIQGINVVPLYYLSLVGMRGEGTTLQGIFSALTSTNPQDIYLEGVGTVLLAHHQPSFSSLGYSIHWNYSQVETADQDLHAVIESNQLTMYDPVRGASPVKRERKRKRGQHAGPPKKARTKERIMLSTATRRTLGVAEEAINREKHPAFLLLVPGIEEVPRLAEETDEAYQARRDEHITQFLSELYFAFLDVRAPWPMVLDWAPYLWQRACERGENTQLTAWFAQPKASDEEEGEEGASQRLSPPVFGQAWFCRPDIPLLYNDLREARKSGRISDLRPLCEATNALELAPA